jgi:hypothetical protein
MGSFDGELKRLYRLLSGQLYLNDLLINFCPGEKTLGWIFKNSTPVLSLLSINLCPNRGNPI